jgi:hypothetical protein
MLLFCERAAFINDHTKVRKKSVFGLKIEVQNTKRPERASLLNNGQRPLE